MAEEYDFPTNAATATIMWGLLAVGVLVSAVVGNPIPLVILTVFGVVIHSAGLIQDSQ